MSIYAEKRGGKPTGRLVVEVQRHGKPLKKYTTSKREASRLQAEMKAGLHDGGSSPEANHSGTSLKVLAMKAESLWNGTKDREMSIFRVRTFLDTLGEVLKDEGLPQTVEAVRTPHITATGERLMASRGVKGSTLNRYLSTGSKAFGWAEEEGIIERSPRFRWKPVEEHTAFVLSEDAEAKLVDALTARGHTDCVTLMHAQLATGCRISELLNREPGDYKDDGDGFYSVRLGFTKNGKERTVVLDKELGEQMIALTKEGMPSYTSVWRRIRKERERLQMPLTQPTHAHRHTIATRLSEDGTETLRLKHFMGHSSLQTTERYVHANVESKKVILKGILMKKGVAHG